MLNIVSLDSETILRLAEGLTHADLNNNSVRICTGSDSKGNWIKYSIGQGVWTPPLYSI